MPMDLSERKAAIDELEDEILRLQNSSSFSAENRWHPEHIKHRAHLERLIEAMRERAEYLEEGGD